MSSGKKRPINKGSTLLTSQENEALFRSLGSKNYAIASGVVQLLAAEPPNRHEWQKKMVGIVCFVKDYNSHGYFLRLYDIVKGAVLWEQQFYDGFNVLQKTKENAPELLTFEGDHVVYGLNFSSKDEATYFATQINKKYEREQNEKYQNDSERNRLSTPSSSSAVGSNSGVVNASPANFNFSSTSSAGTVSGKSKKRRTLQKSDIGLPTNFEHRVHVGWTANVGLETRTENADALDPDVKQLLSFIGFDPNLKLKKKDIQKVYDAVNTIGGLDAVKNEVHQRQFSPPPIASQSKSQAGCLSNPSAADVTIKPRELPPLPPTAPRMSPAMTSGHPVAPPPPPVSVAKITVGSGAPVAPPPPPSIISGVSPPPPAPPLPRNGVASTFCPIGNSSSDLLSQLAKGVQLKSSSTTTISNAIETKPSNESADSRDAMLRDIKEGVILRPVDRQEKQRITPSEDIGGIAGALAKALQERRFQLSDDSESGEGSGEDEWED